MLGMDDLHWRSTILYFGRKKLKEVVRDEKYPNMWRVKHRDGQLSDMVNLTRARDAAMVLAMREANKSAEKASA